jgi:hypothetical protein
MGGVVSGLIVVAASGIVLVRLRRRRRFDRVPISECEEDLETNEAAPIIVEHSTSYPSHKLSDKDEHISCTCPGSSPF